MALIIAAVAQMLGIAAYVISLDEGFYLLEKGTIERGRTSDGQGKPVADQGETFRKSPELATEPAASSDPVFRRKLQEVDPLRIDCQ